MTERISFSSNRCLLPKLIETASVSRTTIGIFMHVGFIVLVSLAAKNTPLIVEAARHHESVRSGTRQSSELLPPTSEI